MFYEDLSDIESDIEMDFVPKLDMEDYEEPIENAQILVSTQLSGKSGVMFPRLDPKDEFTSFTSDVIHKCSFISEQERKIIIQSSAIFPDERVSLMLPRFYVLFKYRQHGIAFSHQLTKYYLPEIFIRKKSTRMTLEYYRQFANSLNIDSASLESILDPDFPMYVNGFLIFLRNGLEQMGYHITNEDAMFLCDRKSEFAKLSILIHQKAIRICLIGLHNQCFNNCFYDKIFDLMLYLLIEIIKDILPDGIYKPLHEFVMKQKFPINNRLHDAYEMEKMKSQVSAMQRLQKCPGDHLCES